ncbi:FadR/GntR family transcriptional regulator [Aeromicrobium wangtongii]|uniref:FCD domain-containing protein n=1 Tax=Aeromicrobium wangtongii TaxID=2969247 RepID=A0ABY5MDD7_9ACTN|nr:FCD domain-containing protein [Aeromicrobium wangtongii]MCD9197712.1 FCD domain-containing protein [Aeromicrobium wangtongii]UUP15196.1 FCD domain-containing protein [Aeromicrobium wangtongii]
MSVTDAAIEKIRELIITGELSPGDRLAPEQDLAAMLGISRSSLREAVKALSQAKVLDVRRGDGTYITSLSPNLLLSGLSFAVDLVRDQTLHEVFEVRRLLEPAATALAATRVTDAQIEGLRRSLELMRATDDPEEMVHRDVEFHAQVVAASGNETLCSIVAAISARALRARIWRASIAGVKSLTLVQHAAIVDALEERDAALASSAATLHLSASQKWFRELEHPETVAAAESDGGLAPSYIG